MMESVLYTTSTSFDGADVPMSIKQEPDDGPQTVLHSDHSYAKFSDQQHLADQKFCKLEDYKDDIPIINIAPIVTSSSCGFKPDVDNVTVKSEPDDQCNSSGTSNPTSVKCEVVPNVTHNLYEVKNEVPCPIHGEIVHNNRLDLGSELVEVPGELDCKPELVGNVNNFVVLGDVNIHTSVQHNDTVNQKLCASTNNCDIEMIEETALGTHSEESDSDSVDDRSFDVELPKSNPTTSSMESSTVTSIVPVQNIREVKLHERNIPNDEKVVCRTNPLIYIKQHRAKSRIYDVVHACVFCGELKTNIQSHLINIHSKEDSVKEIIKLQRKKKNSESKEGKQDADRVLIVKQDALRYKGDFDHNNRVLKEGRGEIILARRFVGSSVFELDSFGPCPYCLGWVKMDANVKRHQQTCKGRSSIMDVLSKRARIQKSDVILGRSAITKQIRNETDELLKKRVISAVAHPAESDSDSDDNRSFDIELPTDATTSSGINMSKSTPTTSSGINMSKSTPTTSSGINIPKSTPTTSSGINMSKSTPTTSSVINISKTNHTTSRVISVPKSTPTMSTISTISSMESLTVTSIVPVQNIREVKLDERNIRNDEKVVCRTNPLIYIKQHRAKSRIYDVVHACVFCGELKTNIQSHLINIHFNKDSVKEIIKLQRKKNNSESKEDKQDVDRVLIAKQDALRYKGDFDHNNRVLKEGRGEIILARRFVGSSVFELDSFGPCPYCLGWLKMDANVNRHQKTCNGRSSIMDVLSKRALIHKANIILGRSSFMNNKKFSSKIFPAMRQDELTLVAQSDDLIVSLGEDWYLQCNNKLRRGEYASSHMRLMAWCLIRLRQLAKQKGYHNMDSAALNTFIHTDFFDLIVEAALLCSARRDNVTGPDSLVNPSVANRIGADIMKVAGTKLCYALKAQHQEQIDGATNFIHMYELRWFIQLRNFARLRGKSLDGVTLPDMVDKDEEEDAIEEVDFSLCNSISGKDVRPWSKEELLEIQQLFGEELKLKKKISAGNLRPALLNSVYLKRRTWMQAKAKLHYLINRRKK